MKIKRITSLNVIKIDVEGDELNVLIGAKKLLKKMSPIIIIELHPWYTPIKRIFKKINEFGYRIYALDGLRIYASKKS